MNESLQRVVFKVVDLLDERNARYGDANLVTYGLLGITIRISDKLSRLITAISNEANEVTYDIVVKDALMDIAGYALNALRLIEEGRLENLGSILSGYQLIKKDE